MREFIKDKLETVYADFSNAAKESEGLCELKKFSFARGESPDYGNSLVRMYYMLKYSPGYLAEYYLMYKKLLSHEFLPSDNIDILSLGCGCGVDYWGYHFAASEQLEKHKSTTSYTGYDINPWEYIDNIGNVNVKYINQDIGKLEDLDSGDYDYNLIVFPKSISDLPANVYNSLIKAIKSTDFKRDKIAILCSLMLDDQAMNYDWSRLKEVVTTMINTHGYKCEDDLDKYITMTNPESGLGKVVPGFSYSLDIENTINSTLNHCPNFAKNGKSCGDDCKNMNRWPILKQKYVNYAIRRLTRDNKMKWRKVQLEAQGALVDAIAPEIISASRSTDIPAFYSDWFFNRLQAGYSKWINPFNQKAQYISFENTRVVIFWSKNPKPLLPYLHFLDEKQIGYYIQFTMNDYEEEGLEPGVPPLASRVETFRTLSDQIGRDRVIWRFDPLIVTESISTTKLLSKIKKVGDFLSGYTSKLVFSFADVCNYKKVQNNLKRQNITHRDFTLSEIEFLASEISNFCSDWGIPAFTCGESVDLSEFGIHHNKCIDDKLILKITNNHPDILRLFGIDSPEQLSLLDPKPKLKNLKDTGQRDECGCVISKDVGQYNTCPHRCVYCYANTSDNVVTKNLKAFTPDGESIIPG